MRINTDPTSTNLCQLLHPRFEMIVYIFQVLDSTNDTDMLDTSSPSTSTPSTSTLNTSTPDTSTPQTSTSNISTNITSIPDTSIPVTGIPNIINHNLKPLVTRRSGASTSHRSIPNTSTSISIAIIFIQG